MSKAGAILRARAAEAVDAVVRKGRSLDVALAAAESGLPAAEHPLLRMICYGTLRHHWRLQSLIDQLLGKPLRKADRVVNALLAIGLYQLSEMRIPDHAVVSQTVEATRLLKRPKLAGLVNACLRRFVRDDLGATLPATLTARWNHPEWLLERLSADWPMDAEAILDANNARAPMWLRATDAGRGAAAYQQRLADLEIHADTLPGFPDALRLQTPMGATALPGFADGDVSVQDGAAQLAARWLLDRPRKRVLDACAAPGGKTGHLLELGGDGLSVTALDKDTARVDGIRENLSRLRRDATIVAADASNPKEWWDQRPFDGILLDAPCSATGVIRRHPDIKLLRRQSDIGRLAALQSALLTALWPLLAPGGRLLYVTCSVLAAENDGVIGPFLEEHRDAMENDVLPNNNIRDLMRKKAYGYQILPGTAGLDGFYFACLEKDPLKGS